MSYDLNDYDYTFPPELIAQQALPRGESRLMVLYRDNPGAEPGFIKAKELPDLLRPEDCIVVNNTKVIPARLHAVTRHGGKAEMLLLQPKPEMGKGVWEVMVKPGRSFKAGAEFDFSGNLCHVLGIGADGHRYIDFNLGFDEIIKWLEIHGHVPLPPYIKRDDTPDDKERYQPVFAKNSGAVAAPTASLHFSEDMKERILKQGTSIAEVTLHVGAGTFKSIEAEDIRQHEMHGEFYQLEESQCDIINRCRAKGGRIICIGTTTARVLETLASEPGKLVSGSGVTHKFIYPPYQWKMVNGLLTNFHWPKSSLLLLVSAFFGVQETRRVYEKALEKKMRLFSYGDGMIII